MYEGGVMEQELKTTVSQLGLSKKTNVAIATMTTLSLAKDSWHAVVAITIVGLVALFIQGKIDLKKNTNKIEVRNDETD